RAHNEWIPNNEGGKENLEAIAFLKHLNATIHARCPGVITIAEESTAFPKVTEEPQWGGLGFDYKWNMGWMNDTLRYFGKDPIYRRYHHNDLTFGLLYAFSEKFTLPLSHDEVVHGKRSLISKMPGEYEEKLASLRLLLSYQICQPGKKLLFMGGEIGQWNEWNAKGEINWFLLQYPSHGGIQAMVKELNYIYLQHPPLWHNDSNLSGFEWVDFSDVDNSIISYRRKGGTPYELLCIHNFTPNRYERYTIHLQVKSAKEIFTSDANRFGGTGIHNEKICIEKALTFSLPSLSTLIFLIEFP
ncbi:MAG: alpha amylase C-terminal domain-containing protein, partial [Chlamydiales bacterium]